MKTPEELKRIREELRSLSNDEILEALFDKDEEDAMELEGIKAYAREQGEIEGLTEAFVENLELVKTKGIQAIGFFNYIVKQKYIINRLLELDVTKEEILKKTGLNSQEYDILMSL